MLCTIRERSSTQGTVCQLGLGTSPLVRVSNTGNFELGHAIRGWWHLVGCIRVLYGWEVDRNGLEMVDSPSGKRYRLVPFSRFRS
jgi:hypothetical protein